MSTETRAVLRGARISPQKARLVADLVRGLPVGRASDVLSYTNKKSALIVRKADVETYVCPRQRPRFAHSEAHQPHHCGCW